MDTRLSAGWVGWVAVLGYLAVCGILAGLE